MNRSKKLSKNLRSSAVWAIERRLYQNKYVLGAASQIVEHENSNYDIFNVAMRLPAWCDYEL